MTGVRGWTCHELVEQDDREPLEIKVLPDKRWQVRFLRPRLLGLDEATLR